MQSLSSACQTAHILKAAPLLNCITVIRLCQLGMIKPYKDTGKSVILVSQPQSSHMGQSSYPESTPCTMYTYEHLSITGTDT